MEIYCMADDFCKEIAKVRREYMVEYKNRKHQTQVFCQRHLYSNGLVRHCPVCQEQGKRVWEQGRHKSAIATNPEFHRIELVIR